MKCARISRDIIHRLTGIVEWQRRYEIKRRANRSNCTRMGNKKELLVVPTDLTKSTSSGYENPIMKHSPVIGRNSYARMV